MERNKLAHIVARQALSGALGRCPTFQSADYPFATDPAGVIYSGDCGECDRWRLLGATLQPYVARVVADGLCAQQERTWYHALQWGLRRHGDVQRTNRELLLGDR